MKQTWITSYITIVLTALTAFTAILIVGFAWLASTKVDDLSLRRQSDFVRQGLQEQIDSVPREQESVTKWDDAVLYSKIRNHEWLKDNIGLWTHTYFGHDRTYIFDDSDRLMFAMRGGSDIWPPAMTDDHDQIQPLVGQLRETLLGRLQQQKPEPIADIKLVRVLLVEGRPAIASARPIIPSSDRVPVADGAEFIAVAVKFLDARPTARIAHYARLEDMHYEPANGSVAAAQVPVATENGTVLGYLVWRPIRPGLMLIEHIAPAGIIGLMIVVGTVLFLGRGLRRTSLNLLDSQRQLMRHRDYLEEMVAERTCEIERQRQELDRLLAQERQVNALQRQFVTMTSHEFRTPLAIIDAAAQRLCRTRSELKPDYVAEKAGQIRSAVLRMVDLMESILAAGRLETGKIALKLEHCSLADIINACCARQREISKNHLFHIDLGEGLLEVQGDKAALEQVFTNLLSNAVKYAPNARDIAICASSDAKFILVSVTDKGIGMDADDLPKLFQPYYRARSATGIAGTGIGLNVVKQIIELHGGSVAVQSVLGRGTTFTVTLPKNGVAASTASQAA